MDLIARLNHEPDYRVGYCRCGCGGATNSGKKKGSIRAYRNGHASRHMKSIHVDSGTRCWIWVKGLHSNGYGYSLVTTDGRRTRKQAHRMVWEWVNGEIPKDLELDHLCRNRACVNPEHLRLVTRAENTQCGLAAKLNPDKVRHIRELHSQGLSERKVAKAVGATRAAARAVIVGHTWRNIP